MLFRSEVATGLGENKTYLVSGAYDQMRVRALATGGAMKIHVKAYAEGW